MKSWYSQMKGCHSKKISNLIMILKVQNKKIVEAWRGKSRSIGLKMDSTRNWKLASKATRLKNDNLLHRINWRINWHLKQISKRVKAYWRVASIYSRRKVGMNWILALATWLISVLNSNSLASDTSHPRTWGFWNSKRDPLPIAAPAGGGRNHEWIIHEPLMNH